MQRLIRDGSIPGDLHCRSEKKSKELVAPGKCARSCASVVRGVSGGRQRAVFGRFVFESLHWPGPL